MSTLHLLCDHSAHATRLRTLRSWLRPGLLRQLLWELSWLMWEQLWQLWVCSDTYLLWQLLRLLWEASWLLWAALELLWALLSDLLWQLSR